MKDDHGAKQPVPRMHRKSRKRLLILDIGSTNLKVTLFEGIGRGRTLEKTDSTWEINPVQQSTMKHEKDQGDAVCKSNRKSSYSNLIRTDASPIWTLISLGTFRCPTATTGFIKENGETIAEIDPDVLMRDVIHLMKQGLRESNVPWEEVDTIGITSQRNTFLLYDVLENKPVHQFISWKDTRTTDVVRQWNINWFLRAVQFGGRLISSIFPFTFAVLSAAVFFRTTHILPRLSWLRKHRKFDMNASRLCHIDAYVLAQLTHAKEFQIDVSAASCSGFHDPTSLSWSWPFLLIFSILRSFLPIVRPSAHYFGDVSEEYFGSSKPITAMSADQSSAAFGHFLVEPGQAKLTLGTGAFISLNSGSRLVFSASDNIYTLRGCQMGAGFDPPYLVEAQVEEYGQYVSWIINNKISLHRDCLSHVLQDSMEDCPCFLSPSQGFVTHKGESFVPVNFSDVHIYFAVLEALSFILYRRITGLATVVDLEYPLRVDGGVSESMDLLVLLATMLNKPIVKPKGSLEMASFGCAVLAGIGCGFWPPEDAMSFSASVNYEEILPLSLSWRGFLLRRAEHRVILSGKLAVDNNCPYSVDDPSSKYG